jgi:hypothetical protein
MLPGAFWVYEGDKAGEPRRDEVRVLDEPEEIAGVLCMAIHQDVFLDGELAEVTTEWFAKDADGNVWKFGEESFERDDDDAFVRTDDSWLAGEDGAQAWLMYPAQPQVGDVYEQPGGADVYEVVSIDAVANVPAGLFPGCMQMVENPGDIEDQDIILCAPGVGLVSEQSTDGRIELTSFSR